MMVCPLNDRFRCLCIYIHKQRYVYLVIMYSSKDASLATIGLCG